MGTPPAAQPAGPPAVPKYETALAAASAFDSKVAIAAAPLGDPILADQIAAYAVVFEIVKRIQPFSANLSYLQFESWCYKNQLAVARTRKAAQYPTNADPNFHPAEFDEEDERRCVVIKGFAFDILRQGFENVVQQKWGRGAQRIPIRKP